MASSVVVLDVGVIKFLLFLKIFLEIGYGEVGLCLFVRAFIF